MWVVTIHHYYFVIPFIIEQYLTKFLQLSGTEHSIAFTNSAKRLFATDDTASTNG